MAERVADLKGRNALVTGGGTGIGFGIAQQLVLTGANVTIAGRRADVLAEAASALRQTAGASVETAVCDITEEGQVEQAVRMAAHGGNLDLLVANAGSGYPGAILQVEADAWNSMLRLNVTGTALCIKHAALVMKEHGGGSVVAISSTSGVRVEPWLATYSVSKAGLDMLVRCAAIELAPHRIRVNSIQPGYTRTESMSAAAYAGLVETLTRATPLGFPGETEDIAHAVLFLGSDAARWITGQIIGVDGGLNIPVCPSMAPIAERVYGAEVVASYALPELVGFAKG